MYLHVGEDVSIRTKDIIAIIDKESMNSSPFMDIFIQNQQEQVFNLAKGPYKSVVITLDKIYFSPFSSWNIKKRSQGLFNQE
ncbi:extracellular matrix regulator RemB [Bacillus sp. T3]|uniref:extracellular matrix regulator RemB n=1 Tax=Bacillus sp. T3 TaxID=467262 RepID=UPI0029816E5C|nr:extracellular matrix/biofilm biosynthesis regulator RemA family protein [Bacillus sp. T3]